MFPTGLGFVEVKAHAAVSSNAGASSEPLEEAAESEDAWLEEEPDADDAPCCAHPVNVMPAIAAATALPARNDRRVRMDCSRASIRPSSLLWRFFRHVPQEARRRCAPSALLVRTNSNCSIIPYNNPVGKVAAGIHRKSIGNLLRIMNVRVFHSKNPSGEVAPSIPKRSKAKLNRISNWSFALRVAASWRGSSGHQRLCARSIGGAV